MMGDMNTMKNKILLTLALVAMMVFCCGGGSAFADWNPENPLTTTETLTTDLTISDTAEIASSGKLIVPAGKKLTVSGTLNVHGELFVEVGGGLHLNSGAVIDLTSSDYKPSGMLICLGTVTKETNPSTNPSVKLNGSYPVISESGSDFQSITTGSFGYNPLIMHANGGSFRAFNGNPDTKDLYILGSHQDVLSAITELQKLMQLQAPAGYEFDYWTMNEAGTDKLTDVTPGRLPSALYAFYKSTYTPPSKNTPALSGSNEIDGNADGFTAQSIKLSIANADFGDPIEVKLTIDGIDAGAATAAANGEFSATLTAAALNQLKQGKYDIKAQSQSNADNYASSLTTVGSLDVGEYVPTTWAISQTFKATKGFSYQLIQPIPAHRALPALTSNLSSKVGTLDANGMLTILPKAKTATHTITIKDDKGERKCKVSIVPNTYSRKKPIGMTNARIYSSTKGLRYSGGVLKGEVFILSNKKLPIRTIKNRDLLIYDGNKLLLTKRMKNITFTRPLQKGQHTHRTFTLTAEEMEQIKQLTGLAKLDLAKGSYEALMTGTSNIGTILSPTHRTSKGVKVYTKSIYTDAGTIEE